MHAFAIAVGLPELPAERLAQVIGAVGAGFGLDPGTAWQARSDSGSVCAAGLHHGAAAAPRGYLHRERGVVTLFDGLPVDPLGEHDAHDAARLAAGWERWVPRLEGQFCAVRIDLEEGTAQARMDTFGLLPLFVMRRGKGTLLSNSVQAIRELLGPSAVDELGVSTMIGFGWASAHHTLLADVGALAGGSTHTVTAEGIATRTDFGPANLDRGAERDTSPGELAEYMGAMIENGVRDIEPLRCAVTAGRDTRLLVAFLRSRGIDADFYTIGRSTDEDVIWARRIAESFDFEHRTVLAEHDLELDWTALAGRFLAQTDGLSSFGQLVDYAEFGTGAEQIGLKLWGIGSEIGRSGQTDTAISAAALPLIGRSLRLQEKILAMKADANRGVMTSEARAVLDRSVADFAAARVQEGWRANEIGELFYIFERVPCHGAAGPRRAAAADDLFSPFCSRRYTEYCLSRTAAERYVERPYVDLLSRVSPELRAYPFQTPLKRAAPSMRVPRAAQRLGAHFAGRLSGKGAGIALEGGRPPFVFEWFEQRRELIEDLFAATDSPLWELIDRPRVLELLRASPEQRYPHLEPLLRAATVVWYFNGPGVG